MVQEPRIELDWVIVYQIASSEVTISVLVVALVLALSVVAGIAGYRYSRDYLKPPIQSGPAQLSDLDQTQRPEGRTEDENPGAST
jgi:hypothetical protein